MTANTESKGGCLSARIGRIGGGKNSDEFLTATISRANKGLNANIGIVCTPNTQELYLIVTPEVLWLAPDSVEYFDIYSNTNWVINVKDK